MEQQKYLLHYRIENDNEEKGEYLTLKRAQEEATDHDYIIEVLYRSIRERIVKQAEPRVEVEIKKSDWLVLGGDTIKRFCIDLDDLPLSAEEKKDPFAHKEALYVRYADYMPFTDVEDIKTISLQRKKFGARVVGAPADTTDWTLFNSYKDCTIFLRKTHGITISERST